MLVELLIPSDCITILPGKATSTQMEASIIRSQLKDTPGIDSSIDSLIIVSSSYYTRRASLIFTAILNNPDQTIKIQCSPSKYSQFDSKNLWKRKEGVQTVLSEYLKLTNFLLIERRND